MVATPPFFDYTIANGFNRWRPIIDADLISKKKDLSICYPRLKPRAMVKTLTKLDCYHIIIYLKFFDMLPTVETAGYG
jgi:hypothetical protein